ncbi:MAG: hypothetical protein ACM3SQ_10910 [Betaproteobacteria bacterium]
MRSLQTAAAVPILLLLSVGSVRAQGTGWLALGGGVTYTTPADPDSATSHTGYGIAWRIGHGQPGFGWEFGFNWFSTDLLQPVGRLRTDLGQLHVRPFMPGYGYSYRIGPAMVTADVIGGYSLNSFRLTPAAVGAYRAQPGAGTVKADVSNAWVVKPELNLWLDLSRTLGLNVNYGYMVVRPTLAITSTSGVDERSIKADVYMLKAALVYRVF